MIDRAQQALEAFKTFVTILDDVEEEGADWQNRLHWGWHALGNFARLLGPEFARAANYEGRLDCDPLPTTQEQQVEEPEEHVLIDCEGDWKSDLGLHLGEAVEAITEYLGVRVDEDTLGRLVYNASTLIADQIIEEFRAGKVREVLSVSDRPSFCFWTPTRQLRLDTSKELEGHDGGGAR